MISPHGGTAGSKPTLGIVSNCVIRNGYMTGKWEYGGGFAITTADGLITHCVITNNSTGNGQTDGGTASGNAGNVGGGGRLEHSLIARNLHRGSDLEHRNALVLTSGAIRFCTIVDNTSTNVAGVRVSGGDGRKLHHRRQPVGERRQPRRLRTG